MKLKNYLKFILNDNKITINNLQIYFTIKTGKRRYLKKV